MDIDLDELDRNSALPQNKQMILEKPEIKRYDTFGVSQRLQFSQNNEASFGFDSIIPEQPNDFEEEPPKQNNNQDFFQSQVSTRSMAPPEKRLRRAELPNTDAPIEIIDLSQFSQLKPSTNIFSQRSKVGEIERDKNLNPPNQSQNLQKGSRSPMFKVRQQLVRNTPKMINLATNEAWKKAKIRIGICPTNQERSPSNEEINASLNRLEFLTINQIKSDFCVNLKAANVLVALKHFEVNKDTVTLVLMVD